MVGPFGGGPPPPPMYSILAQSLRFRLFGFLLFLLLFARSAGGMCALVILGSCGVGSVDARNWIRRSLRIRTCSVKAAVISWRCSFGGGGG